MSVKAYMHARRKLKEHSRTQVTAYLSATEVCNLVDSGYVCCGWHATAPIYRAKAKSGDCSRTWVYFLKPKGWTNDNAKGL